MEETVCNDDKYMSFINFITPKIQEDLAQRGWVEYTNHTVMVRYMANGLWQKLTDDERINWDSSQENIYSGFIN